LLSTKKIIGQWMALQLMCIIILLATSLSEKMNGQRITWQLMCIIIILAMSLSEKMNRQWITWHLMCIIIILLWQVSEETDCTVDCMTTDGCDVFSPSSPCTWLLRSGKAEATKLSVHPSTMKAPQSYSNVFWGLPMPLGIQCDFTKIANID
jgi:hypothetical protein